MYRSILEINDQNLLIQDQDGDVHSQPGFALITERGIETGEEARSKAWHQPQDAYHDFWRQLNQTPLSKKYTWARHHADIAYAQLKQMLTLAKSPESLLVVVPGSFSNEQISLLLGLTKALGVTVESVIDSALATCLEQKKTTVLVELQLHQSVVSLVEFRNGQRIVSAQDIIPNVGILPIHNSVAHHISDVLIENYRYDPLHTSEGEQSIYDQLPEWLMRLRWEDSVSITLPTPQGDLNFKLQKSEIDKVLSQRLKQFEAAIGNYTEANLKFSHGSILIPTLIKKYKKAEVLSVSQAINNCSARHHELKGSDLHRITRLTNKSSPEVRKETQTSVSHLLYDGCAYPLSKPIGITKAGHNLRITNPNTSEVDVLVTLKDQKLYVQKNTETITLKIPDQCKPGEFIILDDKILIMIGVIDV